MLYTRNLNLAIYTPAKCNIQMQPRGKMITYALPTPCETNPVNHFKCFTLFCSLILSRTYSLVNEIIDTQTQLDNHKKDAGGAGATAGSADVAALKKQVAQQQQEYNRLSEELAKAKGQPPRGKSD